MNEFLQFLQHHFSLPLQNPVIVFSIILFIILLSPILLKRINVPSIIGLIVSGIIIGPHGFNIIENNSAIKLFSTIGLLFIMFIAGLELDMIEFKSNKNKSLLFGFFTFIIPLSFGFPICHYLLGLDLNASLLVSSMFSTHTLVTYPIVSRFGISQKQSVAISVGGTMLTDTAVLLLLAVIIGNHRGELSAEFWIQIAISLVIFSAIMFYAVPKIARLFFQKLDSEKHAHFIFVLSVLFFAAFIAELSGFESIIGAFVAGLALNKLIPHSSILMNRIEFIGNALFIPFFLIAVGMIVDVSVIFSGTMALILAFTLTLSAILGKYFAAHLTRFVFKYSKDEGNLIFGLTSAHAAATLAVIMVGFNEGIIDINVLNGIIILILITCVVATIVTENAAKNILKLKPEINPQSEVDKNILGNKVLIPISNLSNFETYMEFIFLLTSKSTTDPIYVLSVVPNNQEAELNINKSKVELEKFSKVFSATENDIRLISTIEHNIPSGISRSAKENSVDIVFVGWPKRNDIVNKFFGEDIDNIVRIVNKTLVVGKILKPISSYERIVLFIPPSLESDNDFEFILNKVFNLSKELSSSIDVYCNKITLEKLEQFNKKSNFNLYLDFNEFSNWQKLKSSKIELGELDLIILINSRDSLPSYENYLENLPTKFDKIYPLNSKFVFYPKTKSFIELNETYGDVSPTI